MEDKTLTCRDCGREFVFSASEQEFYAQRGFTNEPGRCAECRAARKASQGGSGARGGGGGGGFNARHDREMFPAVCAQCGKETQVPFQPRTDRPVYCSDCYATQRQGGGYGRSGGGGGGGGGGRSNRW